MNGSNHDDNDSANVVGSAIHATTGDDSSCSLTIHLGRLSVLTTHRAAAAAAAAEEEEAGTIQRRRMLLLRAHLQHAMATATDLIVIFDSYPAAPVDDQQDGVDSLVQFLLQYISNGSGSGSSSGNHHRWRKLTLQDAHLLEFGGGLAAAVEALLRAAAASTSTIEHVCLNNVVGFPVQGLVGFCRAAARRNNRKALCLELNGVVFAAHQPQQAPSTGVVMNRVAQQSSSSNNNNNNSNKVLLDTLILNRVTFLDAREALKFANVLVWHCWKGITALRLGLVECLFPQGERMAKRIISQLTTTTMNSCSQRRRLRRLELLGSCTLETFQTTISVAAGKAGAAAASLEELFVEFSHLGDDSDGAARFDAVVNLLLRGAAKLTVLRLTFSAAQLGIRPEAKRNFFRAVDALAQLTEIQINGFNNDSNNNGTATITIPFSPQESQWLQGRAARNRNLHRWVIARRPPPNNSSNNNNNLLLPSSERGLLILMLQLGHCPTGRFELARALPAELYQSGFSK